MKQILILISLLITAESGFAQSSLQFSQVKLVSALETVPPNKVWKVESIVYSSNLGNQTTSPTNGGGAINQNDLIIVDGFSRAVRSTRGATSGWNLSTGKYYTIWEIKLPLWLPSGTSLESSTGVDFISIIEFDVN